MRQLTALIVTQAQSGQPIGIITDADVSRAVADGKNPNDVRIYELMTASPTVVSTTTTIRDAAKVMTSRRFRHLPVIGDVGLVGIVDITDVCRALLEADVSGPPAAEEAPDLIRSYRRGPARSQRCSPARVLMSVQDGRRAHRLLYLAAVRDDWCQQEHCQPCLDVGLSAWELDCHTSLTIAPQAISGLWPGSLRGVAGTGWFLRVLCRAH